MSSQCKQFCWIKSIIVHFTSGMSMCAELNPGMYYAYRVAGPASTEKPGDRFNINKVLIDPYGKSVSTELLVAPGCCSP